MDPLQTDTDEFQQSQSIGSMEVAKNCLKIAMDDVRKVTVLGCFGCVKVKEGSKPVQLHITCHVSVSCKDP